jgi:hypothetical protein
MNFTMLATIGVATLRTRGRIFAREPKPIDADTLYPRLMALLRLEVLVMYGFVVLHKLNADYFNPAYSAATNLYREIVEMYWFLPFPSGSWTDPFCIYGAIGCEAAIPLLLTFRRTRLFGVGLGLVFHLMLSPHSNSFIFSFSTLLYAAYFLFLPTDVLGEMRQSWATLLTNIRERTWLFAAGVFFPLGAVLAIRILAPKFAQDLDLIDRVHIFLGAAVRFAWNLFALFNLFAFARAVWFCRIRQGIATVVTPSREPLFRPAVSLLPRLPAAGAVQRVVPVPQPQDRVRPSRCTRTCAPKVSGTTTCSCRDSSSLATRTTSSRSSAPRTISCWTSSVRATAGRISSSAESSRACAAPSSG